MPKLSIVVPIYNVEPYLRRCIDSILAQTYTDFEAILIDDGSPDRCGEIIDEYAQKDSRIVPIHQENRGVSAARNAGLRAARGEYIGFVDPDDWIEANMYELLIGQMEAGKSDIVSCAWRNNYSTGEESMHPVRLSSQSMDREGYVRHLFDMPPTLAGAVWNKLFKKELIAIGFDEETKICEDNLFVAQYCVNITRAAHMDEPLYHIFNRGDSATRIVPDRAAAGLPVRREIIEVVGKVSQECGMKAEYVYLSHCVAFCGSSKEKSTPYYQLAKYEYNTYVKAHWRKITKNHVIPWKNKLFFAKEYCRLLREKGI